MGIYNINEASFEIPDDWEDNSINVFSIKDRGTEFSLVISRDNNPQLTLPLEDYAEEQLKLLAEKLLDFERLNKQIVLVDNTPIVITQFRWKSEAGIVNQMQGYIFHNKKLFVLTGTAPEKLFDQYQPLIHNIIMSLKFRR